MGSLKFAGSRLKRVRLSRRPTKCPNARTARNAMSRYGMLVLLLLLRPGLWGLGAAAMNAASSDEAYAAGLTPEAGVRGPWTEAGNGIIFLFAT